MGLPEVYRDLHQLHLLLVQEAALAHAIDEALLEVHGGWRISDDVHGLSELVDRAVHRAELFR